jgi:nitroreductase
MELMEALYTRRSVRRYEDRPVPRDILEKLLDAAEAAPSAGNLRSRQYIVVTAIDLKKALSLAAYGQRHIEGAGALIIVCADVRHCSGRYRDRASLYAIQDADAAIMCILLAAHDMGLSGCWNGAFEDELVRELLRLQPGVKPVAILSLGYPAEIPKPPSRRDVPVSWES